MKTRIITIMIIALAAAANVFATNPAARESSKVDWKRGELNYIAALSSDNNGVRRSAAGHLGEYRLDGATNDLIGTLRNDKVESIRMAAALALMKIGRDEGRKAVEEASIYDGSDKVAKFCEGLITASNKDISSR